MVQLINTGTANTGNGDSIREAFTKVNANYTLCIGITFPGQVDPVNHWFGYTLQEDISLAEENILANVRDIYSQTGTFSLYVDDDNIGTITFTDQSNIGSVDLNSNPVIINEGKQLKIVCDGGDDTGAFVTVSIKANKI